MIYYVPFIGFIVAFVEYFKAAREHRAAVDLVGAAQKAGATDEIMKAIQLTWPLFERVNQAFDNFGTAVASTFFALIVMQIALLIAQQKNVDNG